MLTGANLSVRITAILLVGFVVSQLLMIGAMTLSGQADAGRPYNLPLPAQVRAMAEALEATPAEGRDALLTAFNDSLYQVAVVPRTVFPQSQERDLLALRSTYADAAGGRTVRVSGERPLLRRLLGNRPRPGRFVAPVGVAIELRTGGFMDIESRPSALIQGYVRNRAVAGATAGLLLLAALLLAVRQTTRPLAQLSRDVRRFTGNPGDPDLLATGPREVREVAQALNEMKSRVGDLIAERTRMLAAIAHDMKTYLTRLRLRAEFIADVAQRERAARDLDEMAALLDDTLTMAMAQADVEPPAPLDLAGELIALVAEHREQGEKVDLVCPIKGVAISARRTGFRRILSNLIDNGLRYGNQVTISVTTTLERATVTVTDNGHGVAEEALARLGEPFHRLDPSRDRDTGGAGLGLAIVRALAAHDNAEVRFGNSQGGGLQASIMFKILPRDLSRQPNID